MRAALYFHLLSLFVLAGGGLGGTIMHGALEKTATSSAESFKNFMRLSMRFAIAAQVGALCMLLSGLFLLWSRGWGDWGHSWLTIKLSLFALLFANGIANARPTAMKLATAYGRSSNDPEVPRLMGRLSIFHATQLIGLAAIVALAVFGP